MGWQKPTQPLYVPGELPRKGVVTDEERANLQANAPSNDIKDLLGIDQHTVERNNDAVGEIIDEINNTTGQEYEWYDEMIDLLEHVRNYKVEEHYFDLDFETVVEADIQALKPKLDSELFFKLIYATHLTNNDFLFGMGDPIGDGNTYIVLVGASTWTINNEKLPNPVPIVDKITVPEFLTRHSQHQHIFVPDLTNMTLGEIRKEMIRLGYIEQHEVAM